MTNYDTLKEYEAHETPVPTFDEWQSMDRLEKIMLQERSRLNKQVVELLEENNKLRERIYEFAEANQSLRKKLDEERAKNRIDYYDGSPMDFLDECERDRKKNKIYKILINNITEEVIISDLRRTEEGNKFIVNLLAKINQALGEEK